MCRKEDDKQEKVVTKEMTEAGLEELAGFSWDGCAHDAGETVRRIWIAMTSASVDRPLEKR